MMPFLLAAALVAFTAAIIDWRTGHIPNSVTLVPLAAAPFAHLAHGLHAGGANAGLFEMGGSVLGALACGAVPLVAFMCGGMGGGDVKLLAALGALTLPVVGLEAETYAFAVALFVAPVRLAYDGVLLRTLRNALTIVTNPFRSKSARKEIPAELLRWFRLGPSIFVGVVAALVAHIGHF
jgi:prepilin peptidase CpaA